MEVYSCVLTSLPHAKTGEAHGVKVISGSVCKVRTQDTDNFDEEVKPLASAR